MIYHTYFLIFLIIPLVSDLEKEVGEKVGENHVLYQKSFLFGWLCKIQIRFSMMILKNVLLMD